MYYPREAERDYLFTRATLIFISMIPLMIMLGLSQKNGVLYTMIKIAPHQAEGTVTGVVVDRIFRSSYEVSYVFQPDSGPRVEGLYFDATERETSHYIAGQPIGIAYSGWSPHFSTAAAALDRDTADFYIFNSCFGLMVLCISLLIWTINSIITHREQDRSY